MQCNFWQIKNCQDDRRIIVDLWSAQEEHIFHGLKTIKGQKEA